MFTGLLFQNSCLNECFSIISDFLIYGDNEDNNKCFPSSLSLVQVLTKKCAI